ncbi:hypothetical protein M885DRAFT_435638 [Pelagophyceae sp. CCMP2097]|nr:hypothetical protein M885DRAFT_435638 [Pelagophyceae sp. CCMP2097]
MAYQSTWVYVTHELYSALDDCAAGELGAANGAPHAWDEAWAFWVGSLAGAGGNGVGELGYGLADKRCRNFGTCFTDGSASWRTADDGANSNVNAKLLRLYGNGQQAVIDGRCISAATTVDRIVEQMAVPLIQGALRYAWRSDPRGGNETWASEGKTLAEFNAFATAVVPLIAACDAGAAAVIARNAAIPDALSQSSPVPDGFAAVKAAFESTYACLGVTCADVGGLVEGAGFYAGMEQCTFDGSTVDDGAQDWLDLAAATAEATACSVDDDENWMSYRRLDASQQRQLTTARAMSCRESEKVIPWVNREVYDIEACCNTDQPIFFLLMTLFWYRAAPTNLEVLLYCAFWPCILIWGYIKVRQIKEGNEELASGKPTGNGVAPWP